MNFKKKRKKKKDEKVRMNNYVRQNGSIKN